MSVTTKKKPKAITTSRRRSRGAGKKSTAAARVHISLGRVKPITPPELTGALDSQTKLLLTTVLAEHRAAAGLMETAAETRHQQLVAALDERIAKLARVDLKLELPAGVTVATPRIEVVSPDYLRMPLGTELPGGLFAGITYHEGAAFALVLGPESDDKKTWAEYIAWAKEYRDGDLADFVPIGRLDGPVLFHNMGKHFNREVYWLDEQYAVDSGWAWGQCFSYGDQYCGSKGYRFRCRLVRRLAI